MNWKHFFAGETLAEGLYDYRKQRVKGAIFSTNSAIARVLGTEVFRVYIKDLNLREPEFCCTCAEGKQGLPCRHAAAVLYAWDAGRGIEPEDEDGFSEAEPFAPAADGKTFYFDMERITDGMVFSGRTYQEALVLYEQKRVVLESFSTEYQLLFGFRELTGTAKGFFISNGVKEPLTVSFTDRETVEISCAFCSHTLPVGHSFFTRREICAHELAFLMLVRDYIRKYDPGDATDWEGEKLLGSFGDLRMESQLTELLHETKTVCLEPAMFSDEEGYKISFRIGNGKMYVLKNFGELVSACENHETLVLGKRSAIHFATETFTDESRPYYEFIKARVHEHENLRRRLIEWIGYVPSGSGAREAVALEGSAADEFYDAAEGKRIPFRDKTGQTDITEVVLQNVHPKVSLRTGIILNEKGKAAGVFVEGTLPELIRGNRGLYFRKDSSFSRLSEEDRRMLEPFMKIASGDRIHFEIGLQSLSEFYYRVLPELRNNPCIELKEMDEEAVAEILPPEGTFDFLLDLEDGVIECRAIVSYDEEKYDLLPAATAIPAWTGYRDIRQERRTAEAVGRIFPSYDPEKKIFFCEKDDDAIFRILDGGIRELMRMGNVSGTNAFNRLKIRSTPVIRIGVSVESGLLDLSIQSEDMTPEELLEVLESYRSRKKYHRLRNGDFVMLDRPDSLEMLRSVFDSMNIPVRDFVRGKLHLPLYRALYLDKMIEEHEGIAADRDRRFRALVKNFKTVADSDYEVPPPLVTVMRKYQVYGYKWLRTLAEAGFGGILADDMGLGKTLQMISVLLAAKENGESGVSLIICPASLVYNWQEEFRRFAPQLAVRTVTGNLLQRRDILDAAFPDPAGGSESSEKTDVLVTSYDLLKRDAAFYEGKEFFWEVLDEAQYIKNPQTAVSKAVRIIRSRHRCALTGTPIENRLSEMWSIFDFLMPGYLYGYSTFRSQIEIPVTREKNEEVTARIRRMVAPFILRRLKKDVLKDLPDKLEEVRYARFEPEQQRIYDGQVVHMRSLLEAGADMNSRRIQILAELTKIRQICCDPGLLAEYDGPSAKREACLELIKSAIDGGHRMLVFSQFTSMLELLEKDLAAEDIAFYRITGSTPKEERLRLVHAFNEGSVPVFLISLKAGGTGLNLTGADMVIHYDPWWNIAAQNQATDRAHRIGQTRKVTVFKLIVRNTIEDKILEMQNSKADLADAILSGEAESLGQMSREQLLELIGG